MDKVGFQVVNSKKGLHLGHESVINFGKQFGEVIVSPVENLLDRNQYLEKGSGSPKYKVNLEKLNKDCEKLGVVVAEPTYIKVPEEKRIITYNRMKNFVDIHKDTLLTERYTKPAVHSFMVATLTESRNYDLMISGPEVLSFFYKRIGPLFNWPERKIYSKIVKNEYGLKMGSSQEETLFDRRRLRSATLGARDRYKVGRNDDLVAELNLSYPKTRGWTWHEILVYEGGFVEGRIEVTCFSYRSPHGVSLIEEVDYYV